MYLRPPRRRCRIFPPPRCHCWSFLCGGRCSCIDCRAWSGWLGTSYREEEKNRFAVASRIWAGFPFSSRAQPPLHTRHRPPPLHRRDGAGVSRTSIRCGGDRLDRPQRKKVRAHHRMQAEVSPWRQQQQRAAPTST
jgi:hypothetical protein